MSLRPAIPLHQYQGSVLLDGPAVEPVGLPELKAHLRIDDASEDDWLFSTIAEARAEIEEATGMALVRQKWRLAIDRWPGAREQWWDGVQQAHINTLYGTPVDLRLPRYPLIEIDSVTVFDEDSTSASVDVAGTFDVDTVQRPGRLALKSGATWPIALRPTNAIQIDYFAGYGGAASDVPAPLRRAIRNMAAYLYSHRGDGCDPVEAMGKSGAASIVNRYKVARV